MKNILPKLIIISDLLNSKQYTDKVKNTVSASIAIENYTSGLKKLPAEYKTYKFSNYVKYSILEYDFNYNFRKIDYKNPVDIYNLFKQSKYKNLKKFMYEKLIILQVNQNVKNRSSSLKFNLTTDKKSFSYSDLKNNIKLKVKDNHIYTNYIPATFKANDKNITVKYISNPYNGKLVLFNKTSTHININSISFYYANEIITIEVELHLAPKEKIESEIQNPKKKFIHMSDTRTKVTIGIEVKYNNENSLLKLNKFSFNEIFDSNNKTSKLSDKEFYELLQKSNTKNSN